MSSLEGHRDALHALEENAQWLLAQVEILTATNEEAKAALQEMVERQALFVQATQDMADKQRALAGQIAGAARCDVALAGQVAGAAPWDVALAGQLAGAAPCDVALVGQIAGAAPRDVVAPRNAEPGTMEVKAVASDVATAWPSLQSAGLGRVFNRGSSTSTLAHRLSLRRRSISPVQDVAFQGRSSLPTPGEVGFLRWARLATGHVLRTQHFGYFISLCVLANVIFIGIEIDMELLGQDTHTMVMMEYFFVSVYVVEMCMHFFADGPGCLRSGWVLFDFALVLSGCVSIFLRDVLIPSLRRSSASGEATSRVDQVLILRMVRLLRLARALRIVSIFDSLWKLVIGFLHSLKTMFSTVVFMTMVIYIFACLGVEFITKDRTLREDEVVADLISERFASVPAIMLTLIQFATMDSVASIYYPLVMIQPWLSAYFMVVLLTLSIAVMNLITAMIVEDARQSTAYDADTKALALRRQVKKMVPVIKDLFRALDRSGDGCIQIDEIVEAIKSKQVAIPRDMCDVVSLNRLLDLFEFLDLDGSGELDEDEFVEGICHLAVTSVPIETMQIMQLLRRQCRDIGMLYSDVHRLQGRVSSSGAAGVAGRVVTTARV